MEIKVEGMMCNRCAERVKKGIESIGGKNVLVSLEEKKVIFDGVTEEKACEKIEDLGYDVIK